jgi:MFS family permease
LLAARLSILMFVAYLMPGTVVPLFSKHLQDLGFSPLLLALCCATQAVGVVFGGPLISQVADRWFPANRCLVVCSLLAGVCLWGLAAVRHPVAVFALTATFWMLCSPATLMVNTICFTHLTAAGKPFGGVRMWGTFGWMVAGWVVGLWLASPAWFPTVRATLAFLPWDGTLADAFRLGGIFGLILALYGLTVPHTPPQPAQESGLAPLAAYRLLRGPSFAVYCICILGVCITLPFTYQATPLLLHQLGTPDELLPATLTIAQSTELLTLPFLTLILGRFGFRGSMMFGLASWALAMLILAIGFPWGLVVGSQVLNGLCLTCFLIAGQVYVNHLARPDLRASVQGLLNSVNGVGMILGHLIVGLLRWLHNGDTHLTFLVAAILTACLVPVFYLGFREPVFTPRPEPTPAPMEPTVEVQDSSQGGRSSPSRSIIRA